MSGLASEHIKRGKETNKISEMQRGATDPEEEPPSALWGYDPLFNAFTRLYISDILQMAESTQVPGVYFYNLHPLCRVDILGTVVFKRERDDFICYGVDDGTGVIKCLCWKSEELKLDEPPNEVPGAFNFLNEIKKVKQAEQECHHLEIGDLVRVRGNMKTSRQEREIIASTYYRVNDPVMSKQISWMMETPKFYREFYDKRVHLQSEEMGNMLDRAKSMIKFFLEDNSVSKFRPHDVEDILQLLISIDTGSTPTDQSPDPTADTSAGEQLTKLLKEALQALQDEGFVYCKVKSQDNVYLVTSEDKDLQRAVHNVIREDSKREKYAEKGCHILHILSAVRQRFSLNVSRATLEVVLSSLECSSDIISPSDDYYISV